MHKKRLPPKKKSNGAAPGSNKAKNSNDDQNYLTAAEYAKKYRNRPLKKNWAKYREGASDLDCGNDEEERPKTQDFKSLLANASSDCSHFEFRSEKEWKKEIHMIPTCEVFNLDLNVLSSGLACVPFYQRIGLDENQLSQEEKAAFDEAAEKQWKIYNPIKENFLKQFGHQSDNPQSCVNDLINKIKDSTLEDLLETKFDSDVEDININKTDLKSAQLLNCISKEIKGTNKNNESETKNKTSGNASISIFNDDENLEEWLDNMLDD